MLRSVPWEPRRRVVCRKLIGECRGDRKPWKGLKELGFVIRLLQSPPGGVWSWGGPAEPSPRGNREARTSQWRWLPPGRGVSFVKEAFVYSGQVLQKTPARAVCIRHRWQLRGWGRVNVSVCTPQRALQTLSPRLLSTRQSQVDICVLLFFILPSPLASEQRAVPWQ